MQIWGLTYTQIWSKMQILEGYAEFESFCLHHAAAEATSLLSSVASLAISYIVTTLIIAYENSRQFLLALRPWGRFARRNQLFSQVTLGLLIY